MKTWIYIFSCVVSCGAAALEPGDAVVRAVKQTSRTGDVVEGTITQTVRRITGDDLEYVQEESIGRTRRENVAVISLAREQTLAQALQNLNGYCQENGGEVEDVTLPTGLIRACKLATTVDNGYAGYRWYAPVGFTNVIKEAIRAEDGSMTETLIQSVKP